MRRVRESKWENRRKSGKIIMRRMIRGREGGRRKGDEDRGEEDDEKEVKVEKNEEVKRKYNNGRRKRKIK